MSQAGLIRTLDLWFGIAFRTKQLLRNMSLKFYYDLKTTRQIPDPRFQSPDSTLPAQPQEQWALP